MASHRRFEERALKPMTAKFTHIGRGLFPLPRAVETQSLAAHGACLGQGEGQAGTSVFTVLTERRKQELTEYCATPPLLLVPPESPQPNAKPTQN